MISDLPKTYTALYGPDGLSKSDIETIQQRLELIFPEDLLRVLEFSTFGSMGYTVLLDVVLDDETAITVTEKMRLKGEIDPCYLFLGNDDGCDEGCYFINCSSGPQRGFVGWIEYDDVNLLLEFVVDPACCIESWDNVWAFMHDIVEREISARKEFGCFPGYPQSG